MTYYIYICNGTKNHVCINNSVLIIIDTNLRHISLTTAGYDYKIPTSTLKFEPSTEITSQCLEIETINDSLPENREVLTLLLSTNSSAVVLNTHKVDTYITDNGGKY